MLLVLHSVNVVGGGIVEGCPAVVSGVMLEVSSDPEVVEGPVVSGVL